MKTLSKCNAAYLAGFIDGEGYIGFVRSRSSKSKDFRTVISISSTSNYLLKTINNILIKCGYHAHIGIYNKDPRPNNKEVTIFSMGRRNEIKALLFNLLP